VSRLRITIRNSSQPSTAWLSCHSSTSVRPSASVRYRFRFLISSIRLSWRGFIVRSETAAAAALPSEGSLTIRYRRRTTPPGPKGGRARSPAAYCDVDGFPGLQSSDEEHCDSAPAVEICVRLCRDSALGCADIPPGRLHRSDRRAYELGHWILGRRVSSIRPRILARSRSRDNDT
jgi:hypothetical protein